MGAYDCADLAEEIVVLDSGSVDGKTFPTSVAFAAWDRLRQCPSSITVDQADVIARQAHAGLGEVVGAE